MRIAVNTRLLLPNRLEGIGWFTHETMQRIARWHPEHEFLFLFDRGYSDEFIYADNVQPVVIGPQSRHPVLWWWWFEQSVPRALKKYGADVFVSPDGYSSLSTHIPCLPVMHDLNFEHYPKDLPGLYSKYYRHYFPKYAKAAKRIATVSEYSKADIAATYRVDPSVIDVVYDGANEAFTPIAAEQIEATRQQHTNGAPYFLFVGALHPRKNLVNLFLAFDAYRKQNDSSVKLLIVGEKKWWTDAMRSTWENMQFRDEVVFAGRLGADALHHVLASALAMVYVSYFEGFGIPILESMYCDVPVITANVTSMPEVAGDAGILVDPFSVDSIANGMTQMATDDALRQQLIVRGRTQREKFSWDKTAERLWESIEKTVFDRA